MTAMPLAVEPPSRKAFFGKPKWVPKRWEIWHEQVVALSCIGKSNTEIASHFGYTPQHISNILNTPEASLVRRRLLDNLRERIDTSIPAKLDMIALKAVERLDSLINNDEIYERSPFAVVDRGLQVIKGLQHLKDKTDGVVKERTIIMPPEIALRLAAGLEKAREARRLNDGEVVEVNVEPS